jgi:type VI secretion system secreted protein Hcp
MPIYMKIDGIDGDVTVQGFERWMEVYAINLGMSQNTTSQGGGGASRLSVQDLNLVKPTGKGSPTLMLACCQGRHLPAVQIVFVQNSPDGQPEPYQKYELERCFIKSWSASGDGGSSVPTESIAFYYTKISFGVKVGGGFESSFWDVAGGTGGGGQ